MDRAGSKRILGMALIATGVIMLVLATLFWTGVISLAPDAGPSRARPSCWRRSSTSGLA